MIYVKVEGMGGQLFYINYYRRVCRIIYYNKGSV